MPPYSCGPSAVPLLALCDTLVEHCGEAAEGAGKDSEPGGLPEPVALSVPITAASTPGTQQLVESSLASGLEREVTDWQMLAQQLRGTASDSVRALRCGRAQLQSANSLAMLFSTAEEAAAALSSDDVERSIFLKLHSAGGALPWRQLFDSSNAGLGAAMVLPTDEMEIRDRLLVASQYPGQLVVAEMLGKGARVRLALEAQRLARVTSASPASLLEAARSALLRRVWAPSVAEGYPLLCSIYDAVPALEGLPRSVCHAMLAGLAAWASTGEPALPGHQFRNPQKGRIVRQARLAGQS